MKGVDPTIRMSLFAPVAWLGAYAVIVWSNASDILLQRFDNAGTKLGGETLVSTIPGSASAQSGVAGPPVGAGAGSGAASRTVTAG